MELVVQVIASQSRSWIEWLHGWGKVCLIVETFPLFSQLHWKSSGRFQTVLCLITRDARFGQICLDLNMAEDCSFGYAVTEWLQVPLTESLLLHSHLEQLKTLPPAYLTKQVIFIQTWCLSSILFQSLWSDTLMFRMFQLFTTFFCFYESRVTMWWVITAKLQIFCKIEVFFSEKNKPITTYFLKRKMFCIKHLKVKIAFSINIIKKQLIIKIWSNISNYL